MYAVLFDIDGTLLQTGGAGQLAFAEAFAREFGVTELSGAVPFAGRSDRAIAGQLMTVHGIEPTEANWHRFRSAYLDALPAALRQKKGQVLPGVVALLDELEALAHPLIGLLTGNVRDGAAHKLEYYGLLSRFSFGGYGDDTDERCQIAVQAFAEAQRAAATRNGNRLRGAIVIGDTPHDVACARSIDAIAVAVPTGNTPRAELEAAGPDILLNDLSDSAELLRIVCDGYARS